MKTPVRGVAVFGGATRAKGKTAHGRDGPVIRNGAGDGIAGAAIGAVGKRVVMPGIFGVGHIGQAIRANAHIRADKHAVPRMSVACHNGKGRLAGYSSHIFMAQRGQACQRRQLFLQAHAKTLHFFRHALYLHTYAVRSIAHGSRKAALVGEPVDKRAKTHSLNLAGSHKGAPYHLFLAHAARVAHKARAVSRAGSVFCNGPGTTRFTRHWPLP